MPAWVVELFTKPLAAFTLIDVLKVFGLLVLIAFAFALLKESLSD